MRHRHPILLIAAALAALTFTGPAAADICRERLIAGRAIHADLQRKAIAELDAKNYKAACKTMQELASLAQDMRDFSKANCWSNHPAKRAHARADDIAARAQEICAQAKMH